MTTYAVITPESEADSNYEQFEYLLGWFDYNGNWQQKLFTDWQNLADYENEVYNKDKAGDIGSVNNSETNRVQLSVEDATLDDVKVFLSIFKAEKVQRIFKDGSTEIVAPDSGSVTYEQRGIRYQFSFDIVHANENV